MVIRYVDPQNGNDGNDGLSFANRKKTLQNPSSAGDVTRIIKSPDGTSLGINATFTRSSPTITLAAALTQAVYSDGTWTASANVTASAVTTRKEGATASQLVIAAAFTTGKAAYFATGALDLSSYQQLSFWIQQTAGTLGVAGDWSIALCSDTLGNTPVNTFAIPPLGVISNWHPFTVDLGSAMSASIQSIALYVNVDRGAQTVIIDNIMACKAPGADALSLTSLIGDTNTDTALWWPIRSIVGTTVIIEDGRAGAASATSTNVYPYATGSKAAYKREPLYFNSTGTWANVGSPSGTEASHCLISGGWNDTDMSTQTGYSFVSFMQGNNSNMLQTAFPNWLDIERYICIAGSSGITQSTAGAHHVTTTNCAQIICGGTPYGSFNHSNFNELYLMKPISNFNGTMWDSKITIGLVVAGSATSAAMADVGFRNQFRIDEMRNMNTCLTGAGAGSENVMSVGTVDIATTFLNQTGGELRVRDLVSATGIGTYLNVTARLLMHNMAPAITLTPTTSSGGRQIYCSDYQNVAGSVYAVLPHGYVRSETSVRHTASGIAWRLEPVSTVPGGLTDPHATRIAEIPCTNGVPVTVKAWVRRTHADLNMGIRVRPNMFLGYDGTQRTYMTAAIDTWEEITLNFTPTVTGVVTIEACAYTTTYSQYGYIDDITVS